jgi:hypothetical protein
MGRLEDAKFPVANAYPGTRAAVRSGARRHPQWCCRDWCSAYEPEDEVDRRYHRSKPYLVETDDPQVVLAAHLGANRDGSEPYVEMAELERPLAVPFWVAEPAQGRMLLLRLDQVEAFRHILASMSRAARQQEIQQ